MTKYCSGDQIKKNEMGGKTWEKERPKCRWEDNIKMDFQNARWGEGGMDWIDLAQIGTGGRLLWMQ